MILIPEQVKIIRDKINELEEKLADYNNYFKECEKTTSDEGFVKYVDQTMVENDYNYIKSQLDFYYNVLKKSEFVLRTNNKKIDYGTKFKIIYDDNLEEEVYTLAENEIALKNKSLNKNSSYIGSSSLLGESLRGKQVGDTFSYYVSLKGRKDSVIVSGRIIEIIRKTKNDIDFIIARPMSERLAKRKVIVESVDCKDNEMTLSQYELLKEERMRLINSLSKFEKYENKITTSSVVKLKDGNGDIKEFKIVDKDDVDFAKEVKADSSFVSRLLTKKLGDKIEDTFYYKKDGKQIRKKYTGKIISIDNSMVPKEESIYNSIYTIRTRLKKVNKLLKYAKIVEPTTKANVGLGSKVSIMTFENGKVQNIRVEVINKALSSEDTHSYVEAISSLGSAIIGLNNNDFFVYYDSKGRIHDGVVYDIDNTKGKNAASPLAYQKKRRI